MSPMSTTTQKVSPMIVLRLVLFVIGGAAAGFAYQRFVGCRTGTCAITANPYASTLYGAIMGYLVSGGLR